MRGQQPSARNASDLGKDHGWHLGWPEAALCALAVPETYSQRLCISRLCSHSCGSGHRPMWDRKLPSLTSAWICPQEWTAW